jgi:hypothetical protein
MAAYSVSVTVINLSSAQVECRKDVFVERRDWAGALGSALLGVIEELPGLDVRRKSVLQDRLKEILLGVTPDYTLGRDRPV